METATNRKPPGYGRQIVGLMVLLAITFAVSAIGALTTVQSVSGWYRTINKPAWTPPDWIFGPVWSVLYMLMAIAAWLVWRPGGFSTARNALALYATQLTLNLGWSLIFFGLHSPGWAAAEIIVLWVAIAATAIAFWRHSPLAAALMTPYLAWVSFAAVLNWSIWQMNGPPVLF